MRVSVSTFSFVVTAASVVLAVPTPMKRQASSAIICPAQDKTGSALTAKGSFVDEGNEFSQCVYAVAGTCSYFFADGTFSSGSSNCPVGLPQTVATGAGNAPTAVNGANGGGATTTKETVPPVTTTKVVAPPVTTTKAVAPPVTTQSTKPIVVTTQSTEAPPPPVTSTTQIVVPPVTTQSTVAPPVTTTSSSVVVIPPTTSTTSTTVAPIVTTSSSVAPIITTSSTPDLGTVTVNVNVTETPAPTGNTQPLGAAAGGNNNGALTRHAGSALTVLPVLCVLFSLL